MKTWGDGGRKGGRMDGRRGEERENMRWKISFVCPIKLSKPNF